MKTYAAKLLGFSLALLLFFLLWSHGNSSASVPVVDVPTGTILPFYGSINQLPAGFLFCNGQVVLQNQYPALYNLLVTANPGLRVDETRVTIPDLRGEFLRGLDMGRNIDPDRVLGSAQADMLKSHKHNVPGRVQFFVDGAGSFQSVGGNADTNRTDPPTSETGGSETRPRNVAVNFIIKF